MSGKQRRLKKECPCPKCTTWRIRKEFEKHLSVIKSGRIPVTEWQTFSVNIQAPSKDEKTEPKFERSGSQLIVEFDPDTIRKPGRYAS